MTTFVVLTSSTTNPKKEFVVSSRSHSKLSRYQFVLLLLVLLPGCGGVTERLNNDRRFIGQILKTNQVLHYMEGCTKRHSCGETSVEREVDRALICGDVNPGFASLYRNTYALSGDKFFTVEKIVDVGCSGIDCTFSYGDYSLLVLKDTKGRLSYKPLFSIDAERLSVCEQYPMGW